jgi:hypothetical protein
MVTFPPGSCVNLEEDFDLLDNAALPGTQGNRARRPATFVTVNSGSYPDFVSFDFHSSMTQIVRVFGNQHCFQYVERRYSGFVALRIVVVVGHYDLTDLGIRGLQRH